MKKRYPLSLKSFLSSAILLGVISLFSAQAFAKSKHIILFGAPGSGKTTQSKLLVKKHGLMYVNFGTVVEKRLLEIYQQTAPRIDVDFNELNDDAFDKAFARSHQLRAKKFTKALAEIKQGEFVEDNSMNVIIAQTLFTKDWSKGFVIDGYPMTVNQAAFLDTVFDNLSSVNYSDVKVIYINVPDEVALKRMHQRGRFDDQKGFSHAKLRDFRANMQPILDYYGDYIVEIDGTQSITDVTKQIEKALSTSNL